MIISDGNEETIDINPVITGTFVLSSANKNKNKTNIAEKSSEKETNWFQSIIFPSWVFSEREIAREKFAIIREIKSKDEIATTEKLLIKPIRNKSQKRL